MQQLCIAFKESLNNLSVDLDYYSSRPKDNLFTAPRLNAISMADEAHILYTNTKKPVDLQRVSSMVDSKELTFLTEEDRLIEDRKFHKWFSYGRIAYGITFIMSIIGIVASIGMCFYCYKIRKISPILGTALVQSDKDSGISIAEKALKVFKENI